MPNRKTIIWWVYAISGVVLIFFLAPAMISAADTFLVIGGIVLVTAYAVWSWRLWIKSAIQTIKDRASEL